MDLQGYIVPPRSPEDKRIAKTENIKFTDGDDGFHYKMLDSNDQRKFRLLNESQEFEELCKSREIKENMLMMAGKLKDGQYIKENKAKEGLKFVPPQFGTTGRNAKAAKKAWESDMSSALEQGSIGSMKTKGAKFQNTILELAKNSAANAEKEYSDEENDSPQYRRQHPTQIEYDHSGDPNSQLFDVVNTMKNKYEQNLHVVEKLFNEKKAMEDHIRDLEYELRSSHSSRRYEEALIRQQQWTDNFKKNRHHPEDGDYYREGPSEYSKAKEIEIFKQRMSDTYGSDVPPYSSFDHRPQRSTQSSEYKMKQSDYEPSSSRRPSSATGRSQQQQQTRGKVGLSAEEIAKEFSNRPQRSHSAPRTGRSIDSYATPRYVRSSADTNDLLDFNDPANVRSSGSRRSFGVSTQLQADADRYVQKRRMFEEKERLAKLQEQQYLQEQKERLLKASLSGRQFTEMFERQAQAEENAKAKAELKKLKEKEEKQLQQEIKAKQAAQKQKLLEDAIKNAPSWQQIQSVEEERRQERVEKRKQELALLSNTTGIHSLMNSVNTPRNKTTTTTAPALTFSVRVRDPAEVARALTEQKRNREQQAEEEKRKQKEKQIALEAAAERLKAKTAMELRKEFYEQKYKKRMEEKEQKERELKRAKELAEERKHQQLLNLHVPIGKNTKSMELKAEKIKMDLERQKAEERKHAAMLKKKALSEKETAAVVRSLVKEREAERRGGSISYAEVNNTDEIIAAKAAAARKEYKAQLLANKKKLEESLKKRPSLLERHDKKVVSKESEKEANKKFKDMLKSSGVGEKDDILAKLGFDEYEDDFN